MELDTVGRWSHDKLELLRKYLEAYTAVLAAQRWLRNGYHYIDGFAGGGRPWSRDARRFIDGSPRVALQISRPFTTYRFIEQEPWRVAQLQQLRTEFPERSIHIDQGDCNHILVETVARGIRYERYNRGLVFLDPFTMNLEWATLAKLAETKALEVFINFPAMALNRTVLVGDPDRLGTERIERMNRFWGSDAWFSSVYDKRPTLFGEERFVKRPQPGKALGHLYQARLQEIFPYVSDPVVMTNSNNAPLYHLIFAGHNSTGLSIITDIFGRFERLAS